MSFFHSFVAPILENELRALEPQLATLAITLIKKMAADCVGWAEKSVDDLEKKPPE